MLDPHQTQRHSPIRSVYAALSLAVVLLVACSDPSSSSSCVAMADEGYNPWNYLAWRDSRNSRFSSITHALPCSSYVKSAPSSLSVPDAIVDCPRSDKQQFYELIGKYDQFIAGWEELYRDDETRSPIAYTEVDSAENFQSDLRLTYEECR